MKLSTKRVRDNNDGKDFEAIERDMTLEGYELEAVEIHHDGKRAFYVYVFRLRSVVDHKQGRKSPTN